MVGDVGVREFARIADQDPGHVQGHVAVADHHGPVLRDIGIHAREMRMRVVPTDEVDGGHTAFQFLAGDAERSVRLGADGVDDGVVPFGKFCGLHVLAHGDVAEEAETGVVGDLVELRRHRLDLRMVRRHARAHQSPRGGQHFEHVDAHVDRFF
ncbi:hypothetical protein MAUB1S_01811 [Mycolicibacterium aubagnense]